MSKTKELRLQLSEELHPRIALIFAQLEGVRADLKKLIDKLDAARLDEEPVDGFFSPAGLLAHIAETEAWWIQVVIQDTGDPAQPQRLRRGWCEPFNEEEGGEPVLGKHPLAEYLGLLDRMRAQTFEFLETQGAADLSRVFHYHARDETEFSFDLEWILQHLVEHEAHHRGQLVLLKRLQQS